MGIVAGYYLHVLYGLFESLFTRIAATFGNQIADKAQWHSQLLRRMMLDVEDVRPHVIRRDFRMSGSATSLSSPVSQRLRFALRPRAISDGCPERLTAGAVVPTRPGGFSALPG